jgi:hypothetical protein
MKFDRKLFGTRLKAALLDSCGSVTKASERLQASGLETVSDIRLWEYCRGEKVPTLERFCQMVSILGLNVGEVFPGWTMKPARNRNPTQEPVEVP